MLRSKGQKIILVVFSHLKGTDPEKNISWVVSETVEAAGILRASVCMEGTSQHKTVQMSFECSFLCMSLHFPIYLLRLTIRLKGPVSKLDSVSATCLTCDLYGT
jgi:hypothetical protein